MRTEQQMYDVILQFATEREDILAVYLNGSRANPNVPKDILQDFDVVYVVQDTLPYIRQQDWIAEFGEIAVMQQPDDASIHDDGNDITQRYAFLMQFADGNRIDLTFCSVAEMERTYLQDKLTVSLLDKQGILPAIPPPSDVDHHVQPPTKRAFLACVDEFWWVLTYAAKGLWREETLFAMDFMHMNIRPELRRLTDWYAGMRTNFSLSVGKNGKYLKNYLPEEMWQQLLATYSDATQTGMWTALEQMAALFERLQREIAAVYGWPIDEAQIAGSLEYLHKAKTHTFGLEVPGV